MQPSSPEKSDNNSRSNHAAGAPTTMTSITTTGTAKNTDKNNKQSIAEGIGHDKQHVPQVQPSSPEKTSKAKNTDKNNKQSIAEGIGHDYFLNGLSDDDASTASAKRNPRKKNRSLSMMRKKPTAKEHLDEMLNNRQAEHTLLRSKKQLERLAARRTFRWRIWTTKRTTRTSVQTPVTHLRMV